MSIPWQVGQRALKQRLFLHLNLERMVYSTVLRIPPAISLVGGVHHRAHMLQELDPISRSMFSAQNAQKPRLIDHEDNAIGRGSAARLEGIDFGPRHTF